MIHSPVIKSVVFDLGFFLSKLFLKVSQFIKRKQEQEVTKINSNSIAVVFVVFLPKTAEE